MTDLFVDGSGLAAPAQKPEKGKSKNTKQDLYVYLKDIRRKNIETLETYKEMAGIGDERATEKCITARSQNELIDGIVDVYLRKLDNNSKGLIISSQKDWLYRECVDLYVQFYIRQYHNRDVFVKPETIRKGMDKQDFIAMRDIIDYLGGLVNNSEQRILDGWRIILSDDIWGNFPDYIKKTGKSVAQMRRKMNVIIATTKEIASKNGKSAAAKSGETTIINGEKTKDSDKTKIQSDFTKFAKFMFSPDEI